MKQQSLYSITSRLLGKTALLSVLCKRAGIEAKSSEKVIPPVFEYDEDGNIRVLWLDDILAEIPTHPFKPNSKEFPADRVADLTVSNLYKHLEHFPTMPTSYVDGEDIPHPVAEEIYRNIIYLRPTEALAGRIKKLGFIDGGNLHAQILEKVQKNAKEQFKAYLDLHSVPKRHIGTFCYLSDSDGIARLAKTLSFGYHRAVACDRVLREASSLKSAERFINPSPKPFAIDNSLSPYVTMLRVAICGVSESMLDGADLFPSSIPKIACNLLRKKVVKDISSVPAAEQQIVVRPYRSGLEVIHVEHKGVDETKETPGTIRLVFPCGVKVAAQVQEHQMVDAKGKPIDIMLDTRTFASKGALPVWPMLQNIWDQDLTREECLKFFESAVPEKVFINNIEYPAYVGYLPVFRPGQRYTELSKPSDEITVDLIAKAILNKTMSVNPRLEEEYSALKEFRSGVIEELMESNNE